MRFEIDDRVQWHHQLPKPVRGTVTNVDHLLEKVYIRWDNGQHGWCYMASVEHLDVITQLGEIAQAPG